MQLSFMEEFNKIQVKTPLRRLFQRDEPEPDVPSLHRMGATVVPLSVWNTTGSDAVAS